MLHKSTAKSYPVEEVPDRVNVTLSDNAKNMLHWLKTYSPEFESLSDAKIISILVDKGTQLLIEEALKHAEPLEDEVSAALTEASLGGIQTVGEE